MEHRNAIRSRAVLKAQIRYNGGLMSAPCVIRDVSETGARLELAGDLALPDQFDLHIDKKNATRRAIVKWRRAREVGVAFADAAAARPAGRDEPLAERVARLESEVAELKELLRGSAARAA